jgi:hypothetical protein
MVKETREGKTKGNCGVIAGIEFSLAGEVVK